MSPEGDRGNLRFRGRNMSIFKKARLGACVMYGGYALAILLTFLWGPKIPVIGFVGLLTALIGYGVIYSAAKCPECSCEWLNGTAGFPVLLQLPFSSSITCRSCGHTVNAKDFSESERVGPSA